MATAPRQRPHVLESSCEMRPERAEKSAVFLIVFRFRPADGIVDLWLGEVGVVELVLPPFVVRLAVRVEKSTGLRAGEGGELSPLSAKTGQHFINLGRPRNPLASTVTVSKWKTHSTNKSAKFAYQLAKTGEFYNLEQLLKTKVFRLRAAKKKEELIDLLAHTLDTLKTSEVTQPFSNAYLNIAEIFTDEFKETTPEAIAKYIPETGLLNRQNRRFCKRLQTIKTEKIASCSSQQGLLRQ